MSQFFTQFLPTLSRSAESGSSALTKRAGEKVKGEGKKGEEVKSAHGFKPLDLSMENQKIVLRLLATRYKTSLDGAPRFIYGVSLFPFPFPLSPARFAPDVDLVCPIIPLLQNV